MPSPSHCSHCSVWSPLRLRSTVVCQPLHNPGAPSSCGRCRAQPVPSVDSLGYAAHIPGVRAEEVASSLALVRPLSLTAGVSPTPYTSSTWLCEPRGLTITLSSPAQASPVLACLVCATDSPDGLHRFRWMAAVEHGKKCLVGASLFPRLRKADEGGPQRVRPRGAAGGGALGLLAIAGRWPGSEAAGSGLSISEAMQRPLPSSWAGRVDAGKTCGMQPWPIRSRNSRGPRRRLMPWGCRYTR